jgi:hypothetical protein
MGKSGSMDQVIGGSSSKAGDRSERKRKMGKSSGSGRKSIGAEGGKDGSRRRWSKAGIIDDKAVKAGEEANKMEERKAVGERMKARSGLLDRALASPAPASSSVLINALPPHPSASCSSSSLDTTQSSNSRRRRSGVRHASARAARRREVGSL